MKIDIKRRAPIVGAAVAGAALAVGAMASAGGGAVAARDQAPPVDHIAVAQTALAPLRLVNQTGAASRAPVNYVKVTDALLRAQPNRTSTKLDVSQPGRGLDLYCYVYGGSGDGGLVWFKTHPWGSRYTGWMRADLLRWGSYPHPGRC